MLAPQFLINKFLIIVAECIRKQARQRKQQRRTRHHQAGGLSWGAPSIPLDPEAQAERELRRHMTADQLWARLIALSDRRRQRPVTPSPTVVQGFVPAAVRALSAPSSPRGEVKMEVDDEPPYFNVASDRGCGDDLVAASMLVKAELNDEENESHDEGALRSIGKGWRPRGDGQARRPRGADAPGHIDGTTLSKHKQAHTKSVVAHAHRRGTPRVVAILRFESAAHYEPVRGQSAKERTDW